jgi:hypothetical protein
LIEATKISVTVTPPETYSISVGAANPAAINPGATSQTTVTITSTYGYTGTVTLACNVTSAVTFTGDEAVCSFGNTSPATVGANGGTATLTFYTVGSSAHLWRRPNVLYAVMLPVLVLAMMGFGRGRGYHASRRKNRLSFLVLSWMLTGVMITLACGGGSGGSGAGGNPSTPAGTYTVTIAAKDATGMTPTNSSPANVTITVN